MGSSGPGRVRVERGIYRQPNGKFAVCWRHAGRLRFRTVGFDVAEARPERLALIAATREGKVPVSPRLRFETVAGWWLERFEAKVAGGERHPRTLEAHRYQLDRHLLPAFGRRRVAAITVDDVAELLHELRTTGRSAKTSAGALATLQSVMRFARRCGWIVADPVERLEHDERPRPQRRRQRVLGRAEIERLLAACSPRDRLMLATVLYTGLRISELLGLVWDDIDFAAGVIHVRAQLSRAHRGLPARRVAPKTAASVRDVPLVPQLANLLNAHRQATRFARGAEWVFATARGTPYGHRNVGAPPGPDGTDRHRSACMDERSKGRASPRGVRWTACGGPLDTWADAKAWGAADRSARGRRAILHATVRRSRPGAGGSGLRARGGRVRARLAAARHRRAGHRQDPADERARPGWL
jgi:integrase